MSESQKEKPATIKDGPKDGCPEGNVHIHPTAIVQTSSIGPDTRIWAFAHVLSGVVIGDHCNIGDHAFLETGAVVGNNVTLKNHVCVWEGVVIEDDVFVGPSVVFTNDRYPRSPRMAQGGKRYCDKANWLVSTIVRRGCSIGAGATILAGVTLGRYCLIAAGAVVTSDVEPHALMVGVPARRKGCVCRCGKVLDDSNETISCPACGFVLDLVHGNHRKAK